MKIRIAFVNDIPKIMEVAEATWKQTYAAIISQEQIDFMYDKAYTNEAILQQMQNGHTFLIYIENDTAIGFMSYYIREDNILYITKLYINPTAQGKGVGKILLQEAVKIAKKNKLDFVELNVNRKNPAMYFYKKNGFELFEKADIAIGKYWMNDYVLRKKIGG